MSLCKHFLQIAFLDALLFFLYNFSAHLPTSEDFSLNFIDPDALHQIILLTGQTV